MKPEDIEPKEVEPEDEERWEDDRRKQPKVSYLENDFNEATWVMIVDKLQTLRQICAVKMFYQRSLEIGSLSTEIVSVISGDMSTLTILKN